MPMLFDKNPEIQTKALVSKQKNPRTYIPKSINNPGRQQNKANNNYEPQSDHESK